MSAVTKAIGLAKKLKHRYQDEIRAHTPVYLSPVRRIERVSLPQRVCAMTFDDGSVPPACKPVFRRNASDAVASGVSGSVRRARHI